MKVVTPLWTIYLDRKAGQTALAMQVIHLVTTDWYENMNNNNHKYNEDSIINVFI